jgi:MoxR-like ATPase
MKAPNTTATTSTATSSPITQLQRAVAGVIRGKDEAIELALVALLARGHLLIEDVPGVGKTTLAQALAHSFHCSFQRIQFTSDMLPSDVVGISVFNQAEQQFDFKPGPIFANIVLADEINRTTPKTQSALLEAMEERQVTIDGTPHRLGDNFFVVATQNPIELEGTYPLPEAQTDRFLIKLRVSYPESVDEVELLKRHHRGFNPHDLRAAGMQKIWKREQVAEVRRAALAVKVEDTLFDYMTRVVRATRQSPQLRLGASPRAGVGLLAMAKARAALRGNDYVTPDDIKLVARPVLRHRLVLKSEAEIEGVTVEDAIGRLLDEVEVPR